MTTFNRLLQVGLLGLVIFFGYQTGLFKSAVKKTCEFFVGPDEGAEASRMSSEWSNQDWKNRHSKPGVTPGRHRGRGGSGMSWQGGDH